MVTLLGPVDLHTKMVTLLVPVDFVTGHPLSGLVRVQPVNSAKKYNVCDEGFESLTPLYKGRKTL
jgi:hypothetical protein